MGLRFLRLTIIIATGFLATSILEAAAPDNDDFADAMPLAINVSSAGVNNTDATSETGEPFHRRFSKQNNRPIWYSYTAEFNGYVEFDTNVGLGDTVMAAYTGKSLNKLTCIGQCDDIFSTDKAKLMISVSKGIKYSIAIDSYSRTQDGIKVIARPWLRHQTAIFEAPIRMFDTSSSATAHLSPYKDDFGKLVLTLNTKGGASGRLHTGSKSHPFTATVMPRIKLDQNGQQIKTEMIVPIFVNRPGQLPAVLTVLLNTSSATGELMPNAEVTGTIGILTIHPSQAYMAAPFTAAKPSPRVGTYNFISSNVTNGYFGHPICSFTVNSKGACRGAGFLGDGTPFTWAGPVLNDGSLTDPLDISSKGRMIVHKPLYKGQGQASLVITFNRINANSTRVAGFLDWIRPPSHAVFIPYGIDVYNLVMGGHQFKRPKSGRIDPMFDAKDGAVKFTAYTIGSGMEAIFTLTSANKLIPPANNPHNVKLSINAKTGILTGSFKFTNETKAAKVRALLMPTGVSALPGFRGYNLMPHCGDSVSLISLP